MNNYCINFSLFNTDGPRDLFTLLMHLCGCIVQVSFVDARYGSIGALILIITPQCGAEYFDAAGKVKISH